MPLGPLCPLARAPVPQTLSHTSSRPGAHLTQSSAHLQVANRRALYTAWEVHPLSAVKNVQWPR